MGVALDLEINKVEFNKSTGSYISFEEEFAKFPYITVVVSGTAHTHKSGSQNINSFVSNVSKSGFSIEFSDAFTGYVHYKAARAE
tara:strand:- start:2613 stop:2867 length:255 start_codon:yes stop_codon:yes gene_type:complete